MSRFAVLIPANNAAPYIVRSLTSVLDQILEPPDTLRILVLNDGSVDATDGMIVATDMLMSSSSAWPLLHLHRYRRGGAVARFYEMIHLLDYDEIAVFVDADDWLAHPRVVEFLAGVYRDNDVWATYGSYAYCSGDGRGISQKIEPENHTRRAGWRASHLKTARAWLLQKIFVYDLQWPDGTFFDASGDLALFYPVIEMAGAKHARYIDEILYIYNPRNTRSETHTKQAEQRRVKEYVESRAPYLTLDV
jgi:glycosyltransferase involved in cell wall biosynthesis